MVENKGTGYFRMCESMRRAGHPAPVPQDHLLVFGLNLYKKGCDEAARWAMAGGGAAGATWTYIKNGIEVPRAQGQKSPGIAYRLAPGAREGR